jgi:hypothetical protein
MSDAKTVEAETRMQADDLVKAEASVLIISISTKTRIGLFLLFSNKNLHPARNFFLPGIRSQRGPPSSTLNASDVLCQRLLVFTGEKHVRPRRNQGGEIGGLELAHRLPSKRGGRRGQ